MLEKEPPQDLSAEAALLGALLVDKDYDYLPGVLEIIPPEDAARWFYRIEHRAVYRNIVEVYSTGKAMDLIVFENQLKANGDLIVSGGRKMLIELIESFPAAANAHAYAKIVREKGRLRDLMALGRSAELDAVEEDAVSDKALARAMDRFVRMSQQFQAKHTAVTAESVATQIVADVMEGRNQAGIPTGIGLYDEKIVGLLPGEIMVIAARPSLGKTSMLLQILSYVSEKKHLPTLLFSLEMGSTELVRRILAARTDASVSSMRRGHNMPRDQRESLQSRVPIGPIHIDDTASLTTTEFMARCHRMVAMAGVKLIGVDYLQLMSDPSGAKQNKNIEISNISRALKLTARTLGVPIIVLSQLNRDLERTGRKPTLADLRDSGAIEQDADIVSFIYAVEKCEPTASDMPVWVSIDKHRNGPLMNDKMKFVRRTMTFEAAPEYVPH